MENRFKLFTVLTSKVNRYIRKIKTDEMAEFNLKSTHVSCLYYLYSAKNITSTDLCELCEEAYCDRARNLHHSISILIYSLLRYHPCFIFFHYNTFLIKFQHLFLNNINFCFILYNAVEIFFIPLPQISKSKIV